MKLKPNYFGPSETHITASYDRSRTKLNVVYSLLGHAWNALWYFNSKSNAYFLISTCPRNKKYERILKLLKENMVKEN